MHFGVILTLCIVATGLVLMNWLMNLLVNSYCCAFFCMLHDGSVQLWFSLAELMYWTTFLYDKPLSNVTHLSLMLICGSLM